MVALLVALLIAFAGGVAKGQQVDEAPVEPLLPMLQQPACAAPVLDASPEPFQEIGCCDECAERGALVVQESYWYAGADVLVTQFSYQSPLYYNDQDGSVAVRPYLGWESSSGVGIRGRWWFFRVGEDIEFFSTPGISDAVDVAAGNFDLDFYRRFFYDRTNFLLGAGTKVATISFDYESIGKDRLVGGGVSVFAEGHHPLYRGPKMECAFVGYGRFGLLTGRVERRDWPVQWDEADTNMAITEVGLGLELKRKLRRSEFVFQIVSEVQRWETNMTSDLAFDALGLRFGGQW